MFRYVAKQAVQEMVYRQCIVLEEVKQRPFCDYAVIIYCWWGAAFSEREATKRKNEWQGNDPR